MGREDESAPVTRGDYALEVSVEGDSQPAVRNQRAVRDADFTDAPYLLADVLPGSIADSDSAVSFRFRYHSAGPGDVAESPEITVEQRYGQRLAWDMSEIADEKLAAPRRLEIAWYPADRPVSTGPQGKGSSFDYRGRVYLDNVHLTDNRQQVTITRWVRKRRELQRSHGFPIDDDVQSSTDAIRAGRFVYDDGTEIPYSAEILAGGDIRIEIDDERFRFEGVAV
ncbi:hypothetical protein [Halorussus aquaticus]|uniref:Uncharacterized protein n=1 Tax=Halorussus aquaticus TaxID=2953748 RepID=A0ABD5PZR5_9EURY|nr:hypothetical protein [Halorussus aquaticus]